MMKKWETCHDARVRPTHREAEAEGREAGFRGKGICHGNCRYKTVGCFHQCG